MRDREKRLGKQGSRWAAILIAGAFIGTAAAAGFTPDEAADDPGPGKPRPAPFYLTTEYERIKAEEKDELVREAEAVRERIENHNLRRQAEAEEAFKAGAFQPAGLIEGRWESETAMLENFVQAEAGNQDLVGRRLVAGVVLNRVDDPDWPDTIQGVISQPYQMSSYWDGGMDKWAEADETTKEAVRLEMVERSYPGIVYFTSGGYSEYGTPYMKHGDHYFSTK